MKTVDQLLEEYPNSPVYRLEVTNALGTAAFSSTTTSLIADTLVLLASLDHVHLTQESLDRLQDFRDSIVGDAK